MRLQVLAGLAAVATAAEQFEDDDVNFLRMLSSNATVNGTTTAAPTTTTAAPNTTTAAPTTTVANTTTGTPTTTGAPTTTGSSNVTTTGAPTTTGGQGNQEQQQTQEPVAAPTALCSAAAYTAAGLVAPSTFLDTMADYEYMNTCSGETQTTNIEGQPDTAFYNYGSRATAQANKDKCASPSTLATMTCGSSALLASFNEETDPMKKTGMVQKCCGAVPGFAPMEVANFKSVGDATWGNYSDAACSTAVTGDVTWPMSAVMTANPMTFALGGCVDGGPVLGGAYIKFSSCNTTHMMTHRYFDSACTEYMRSGIDEEIGQCKGNGANNTAFYEKWACTATAPATKQFSTTLSVDFGGLAGLSATQLTAVKDAYEPKALATFTTALNNADATITPTHTYSGALATARRRLAASRRRLSGTGGVTSVFVTTLPAAAADTAQASIVTATSGAAALTPAAFKSTIETELSSNTATSSFASNITATVAAPVVTQTTAVQTPAGGGGGAGSTSGAVTSLLGLGSALVMAVAVMF